MQNGAVSLLATSIAATAAIVTARFVGEDGAHAAAGGNSVGISRFDAEVGDQVALDVLGTALVEAGGVVADWDLVEVGADGKAVTKTTGVAVARVQGAGGAAGSLLEVLLIPN